MLGKGDNINCVKRRGGGHSHSVWVINTEQNTRTYVCVCGQNCRYFRNVNILLPPKLYSVALENLSTQLFI